MSEQSNLERVGQDEGPTERESLKAKYDELNMTRSNYEKDGQMIHQILEDALCAAPEGERTETERSKIDKLKAYLESDESALSGIEIMMADTERRLGVNPDESSRFDNCENDMLVNSAVFYHERINSLRMGTGDSNIDKAFIDAVVDYANAVEHDSNSVMLLHYDDAKDRQAYIASCQRRRSNCHNNMIDKFNKLNDLARESDLKPLTYRNLITNSSTNDFRNNAQMYHDRVTLARYVGEVIQLGFDKRFPDAKYIKET